MASKASLQALFGGLVTLGFVAIMAANGNNPSGLGDGVLESMAPQTPAGARLTILTTADTTYCLGDGSTCDLFPMGSLVVVKAQSGNASCALSMATSSTTTLGTWGQADQMTLTDASGVDGPSMGDALAEGSRADFTLDGEVIMRQPGQRITTGICGTRPLSVAGTQVAVGCTQNADCTGLGAGSSCDTTLDDAQLAALKENGAVTIVCVGEANSAQVYSRIEK